MIRFLGYSLSLVLTLGVIAFGASQALSRASERTVIYQYISDALDALDGRPDHVTWQPATDSLTRAFTPGDEHLLGTAMTHAWSALALAQDTGESAILRDVFTGVAQERAEASVVDAQHGGQMIVLSQEARPRFYHLDGSVFQAQVDMLTARYLIDDGDLAHFELATDQTITTLMNESNGWRIYAHERFGIKPFETNATPWTGTTLAGFNYYPAETPWSEFWPAFDEAVIKTDFDRLRELGANAVRIFLTTETFTNPKTRTEAAEKLVRMLDLAGAAGIAVVPTLFDLKPGYDPSGWGQDHGYLETVLPILGASPAVAYIDLKNEPDLDFERHGRGVVHAWLKTMAAIVRHDAPGVSLTIGWSNAEVANDLMDTVDLVTYHDYAPLEGSADRLAALRAQTDLPVMITEIGETSYSLAVGLPSSEDAQSANLESRMAALSDADGLFVWTLYDFPNVEASAVGTSPWVQRLQGKFGVLDADGNEKPSASIVRDGFARFFGP